MYFLQTCCGGRMAGKVIPAFCPGFFRGGTNCVGTFLNKFGKLKICVYRNKTTTAKNRMK
jgi:hypothetical protein